MCTLAAVLRGQACPVRNTQQGSSTPMKITQAVTPQQIELARVLFEDYAKELAIDLCFQGFAAELSGLPGVYAPPRGRLLLGLDGRDATGCVALRQLDKHICEMKRLFVRSGFRGKGIGKLLAQAVVEEARAAGYQTMRLDTLSHLKAAMQLYEALGFARCPAYYETPLLDTVFMELQL